MHAGAKQEKRRWVFAAMVFASPIPPHLPPWVKCEEGLKKEPPGEGKRDSPGRWKTMRHIK